MDKNIDEVVEDTPEPVPKSMYYLVYKQVKGLY